MSLRLRLLLVLLAVYCVGGWLVVRWGLNQVRPRYLESMEATLVDSSALLAATIEPQVTTDGRIEPGRLRDAFAAARRRPPQARIFSLEKDQLDLRVYVTDATGRVLYDSTGRDVGRDFSRWNDVCRTLRGQYGARSTRTVRGDDDTQVIYVAAPIRHEGRIVGVLSVGQPTREVNQLVAAARRRLLVGAVGGGIAVLVGLLAVASWVVTPLERLTTYARAVRDGRAVRLPKLPGRTLDELGTAFVEMRDALEGRQQVERYTQAVAHEIKAPLAAIRGAAELLGESLPPAERDRFLDNIRGEAARIQRIVDRLLELSSLEARKALRQTERIDARTLLAEAEEVLQPAYAAGGVRLAIASDGAMLRGEHVLLREALVNLLQNALDFSPRGGEVRCMAIGGRGHVVFSVEDSGPGVPEYGLPRVFERFYSLPRPGTGRKSTGLGLALVREIAHLHGGEATLANRPEGGARAVLSVPAEAA